ncbi:MAG: methyltransferase domain-containing protein [Pseudomonadota bacterium]|nr:methyltransferase domain-containing protein [Pseudomonadota bacterium]
MTQSNLHDQRVAFVTGLLLHHRARRVVDLGCGAGRLVAELLSHSHFANVTGLDSSAAALAIARQAHPAELAARRLILLHGSITEPHAGVLEPDAVALVEVVEHLDPGRLSKAEHTVFRNYRPSIAVVTTPNAEYNPLLGLAQGERRDPDHRFEWSRQRFQAWAGGVARRNGYRHQFGGIGEPHRELGHPTQYALFHRIASTITPA